MKKEKALIPCPHCHADLLDQTHSIHQGQVTLLYSIVGKLELQCNSCGASVGETITRVINNYSAFFQYLLSSYDMSEEIVAFVSLIDELVSSLPPGNSRISKSEVLDLRFGLRDGQPKSLAELATTYGYKSAEGVRQIQQQATRLLRHPTKVRLILKQSYRSPDFVEKIIARMEVAENKLQDTESLLADEKLAVKKLQGEIEHYKQLVINLTTLSENSPGILDREICNLPGIKCRTWRQLLARELHRVGEALTKSLEDLLTTRNFGRKSLANLLESLERAGIRLEDFWTEEDLDLRYKQRN